MPANVAESSPSTVTTAVTSATTLQASKPYVGARPFERWERGIFFGRDPEAGRLRDKILTSRLTLFYAPSGAGKSSLLKTRVIPYLEQEHARVIYLDQWATENPFETVRAAFIQVALQLGVSDPAARDPTLAELGLRIAAVDERPLVLIFDQFEQFMIAHGDAPDPLRKELGGLVRASTLEVHIVLSVRQEFLAALEPLRAEVMNLFQSTDVLERLDDKGVREAIQRPAELFGVRYEPALLDRLLSDLRVEQASAASPDSREASVSLTMMQLVCDQLWIIASQRGAKIVTSVLYDELGGVHKILETYVRGVMPHHLRDRYFTARLMKYLAPSSGYKKPYSADELSDDEHLNKARVSSELNRLSTVGVLRQRDFHGQQLFELQHDSMIKFIGPWREKVLDLANRWRYAAFGLAVLLLCALLMAGNEIYIWWYVEHALGNPKKATVAQFEASTNLLLRKERYGRLLGALKSYATYLPASYGFESLQGQGIQNLPAEDTCPYICLHYSSRSPIDAQYFGSEWRTLARRFVEQQGVPVPARLTLREEPTMPTTEVRLTGEYEEKASVPMPSFGLDFKYDEAAFIDSTRLPVQAQEVLKQCAAACKKFLIGQEEMQAVPLWSRPVWRALGVNVLNRSSLTALLAMEELKKNPKLLLTDEAYGILRDLAFRQDPDTFGEASSARGGLLRSDFAKLLSRGRSLVDLVSVLDALASHPRDLSLAPEDLAKAAEAAEDVDEDLRTAEVRLPSRFGPQNPPEKAEPVFYEDPVYRQSRLWMPATVQPIVVYLGRDLSAMWSVGRREAKEEPKTKTEIKVKSEISDEISNLEKNLFERFGVRLPAISFRPASGADLLTPMAFRIEIASDPESGANVQAIPTEKTTAVATLVNALQARAERLRIRWITAKVVVEQQKYFDPALRNWLEGKYSITEQKLLMRGVISPPAGVSSKRPQDSQQIIPPENTLRHAEWLLASLVFWTTTGDARAPGAMIDGLRRTQRALLTPVAPDALNPVTVTIAAGIRDLEAGRMDEAHTAFLRAVIANQLAAERAFLALYAPSLRAQERLEAEGQCSNGVFRGTYASVDNLEHFLSSAASDANQLELRLCLLSAYANRPRDEKIAIEADILQRYPNPNQWEPDIARSFAVTVLSQWDPYTDPGQLKEHARRLLKNGVLGDFDTDPKRLREGAAQLLISAVQRLDPDHAFAAFAAVAETLGQSGPQDWKWKLLRQMANARPDPSIRLSLANKLVDVERAEDMNEALALAIQLEREFAPLAKTNRFELDWSRYIQARALNSLSRIGALNRSKEAEEIFKSLKDSTAVGQRAEVELIDMILAQDRYEETITLARRALTKYPDGPYEPALRQQLFLAQLLRGDKRGAIDTADQALQKADQMERYLRDEPRLFEYLVNYLDEYQVGNNANAEAILAKIDRLQVRKAFEKAFVEYLNALKLRDRDGAKRQFQQMEGMTAALKESYPSTVFAAALTQTTLPSGGWEETDRKFLETSHEYVPYIALMLYAGKAGSAKEEARDVLREHWENTDWNHWDDRLKGGDVTAWREMLVASFLAEIDPTMSLPKRNIFEQLKSKESFAASDLRFLPMSREEMRCEAYFYDSLLAEALRNEARDKKNTSDAKSYDDRSKQDLRAAVGTNVKQYIEYSLAKFKLTQEANK